MASLCGRIAINAARRNLSYSSARFCKGKGNNLPLSVIGIFRQVSLAVIFFLRTALRNEWTVRNIISWMNYISEMGTWLCFYHKYFYQIVTTCKKLHIDLLTKKNDRLINWLQTLIPWKLIHISKCLWCLMRFLVLSNFMTFPFFFLTTKIGWTTGSFLPIVEGYRNIFFLLTFVV